VTFFLLFPGYFDCDLCSSPSSPPSPTHLPYIFSSSLFLLNFSSISWGLFSFLSNHFLGCSPLEPQYDEVLFPYPPNASPPPHDVEKVEDWPFRFFLPPRCCLIDYPVQTNSPPFATCFGSAPCHPFFSPENRNGPQAPRDESPRVPPLFGTPRAPVRDPIGFAHLPPPPCQRLP